MKKMGEKEATCKICNGQIPDCLNFWNDSRDVCLPCGFEWVIDTMAHAHLSEEVMYSLALRYCLAGGTMEDRSKKRTFGEILDIMGRIYLMRDWRAMLENHLKYRKTHQKE